MNPIRRILCAIDLEQGTSEIIRMAATVARACGAQLTMLYVVDSPLLTLMAGSGPLKLPEDEAEAVERATVRLRAQAEAKLRELALNVSPETQILILEGPPVAGKILEAIERHRPDLLVVGSHGKTTIKRLLVGSVCDRMVHASPVPVLVVKSPPEGWSSTPFGGDPRRKGESRDSQP
jgi:nucleotide-binding universal stress UspA family protein